MARPQKQINAAQVRKLAAIMCTTEEMADILGCSKDTLERRFAADIKKGRSQAKSSLRSAQFKKALRGNAIMQIWLGKQHLGQTDKPVEVDPGTPLVPETNVIERADSNEPGERPAEPPDSSIAN